MILNSDSRAVIYGAFYLNGKRITDFTGMTISCVILNMEGVDVTTLEDVTTAEDGSVCVVIEPNTLNAGRYYYHIVLNDIDNGDIAEIKNELEVV